MLAGYLPFDDDPANPDGDNINLLYKYIVSTPLAFPDYVSPHARDLLRRILVPDPRKRADLFEVARHSWLSPYSNVVALITSGTTKPEDIANTTITSGMSPRGKCFYGDSNVQQKFNPKSHLLPAVLQSASPLPQQHMHTALPSAVYPTAPTNPFPNLHLLGPRAMPSAVPSK